MGASKAALILMKTLILIGHYSTTFTTAILTRRFIILTQIPKYGLFTGVFVSLVLCQLAFGQYVNDEWDTDFEFECNPGNEMNLYFRHWLHLQATPL